MLPPKSEYLEVEGVGKIDKSIAEIIEFLNNKGFVTLASCSGMKSEHDEKDISKGYVSFDLVKSGGKLKELIKIAVSLGMTSIEEGNCYFKESITLRFEGEVESDLKEQWMIFYDELVKRLD